MAVQGVNSNTLGAYYPKYLEDKKRQGLCLGIIGGGSALSSSALYFSKHAFAVKNPKLVAGMAILSAVFSLLGISGAAKAQKELNEFNKQSILNVKV